MGSVREAALRLKLIDGVSGPAKGALAAMRGVRKGIDQFNANAAAANASFRSALADVAILGAGLVKPIRDAMKFQTALADFNKLANLDAGGLQAMGQQFTELSKRIPLTVEELLNVGSAVASTGAPMDQIVARTEMIAKAAVAWGMSTDQAGESLSKISTALGLSVGETQSLADVINYLGNSTAAEAPALADFMQRIGGMGKMAGLTAQQTTALGASIISMGVPSEVAATGLQALLRSLTKGSAATKGQQEAFRALGLDARKTAKNMQMDGDGTILDVLERIRALPADKRLSVANQLFGDEGRPILALIDQLETVKKNLREAQDEAKTAGSVQDEYSQAVNTTATRLMLLANRAKTASKSLGKSLLPVVDDLSESTGGYLDRMTVWLDANQAVAKKVVLTAVGMAGMRVAMTGARAAMYALLRPSNLLIAGLGALAYTNFDAISGALRDLKALATDLAGTSFVKGFLSGAGEALKTAGEGARQFIGALRELSAEGSGLRARLDSLEGGGWGQTLGKAAVALGGLGAAAAAVGMAVGPLRTFARVALWLSGIKPALGLLRFLRELGRSGEAVKGVGKALGSVGDQAATAGESAGTRFGTSLATAAKGAISRAGLGAWLMTELVGGIPSDKDELQTFFKDRQAAAGRVNDWMETNVGTPRKWLGLDKPADREPVIDQAKASQQRDELDTMTNDWPAAARRAILSYGNAIAEGGPQAEAEAVEIGDRVKAALTVEGRPTVATADIERALGLARQLAETIRGVPAARASSASPATSVPPFGGPRAKGGPVRPGRSYLVGERGPEIVVPRRSGTVVPNHAFGGRAMVKIEAPIHINQHINGSSAGDLKKLAEDAARAVTTTITGQLDRQLNRSSQVAFGGLKPYGEE